MTMSERRMAADDRRFLWGVFAAGVVLRLLWHALVYGAPTIFIGAGEAARVALAVAEGRGFADAYFAGQGPTAHLLPVNPAIAGLILDLLGTESGSGNLCLMAWSLGQCALAYWLLYRLFAWMGVSPVALRWSVVILSIVPLYFERELVDFRYWEGALALALLGANLIALTDAQGRGTMTGHDIARASLLCAAAALVCPPVGLGAVAAWGFFALRRLPWRTTVTFAATGAAAMALILGPWMIRNMTVLDSGPLLRSNVGLELAIANHPGALADLPPATAYTRRLEEVHPFVSSRARAAMEAAGGEVAYSAALGRATRQWISDHPAAFARLSLRHLRQLYFPEPWMFTYSESDGRLVSRALVTALVNLIGLIGLAVGLVQRRRGYGAIAVMLGCISLPYMLVQPMPRYTFLLYAPLLFVAADTVARAAATLRARAARGRTAAAFRADPA
jgi:hypothetical protein